MSDPLYSPYLPFQGGLVYSGLDITSLPYSTVSPTSSVEIPIAEYVGKGTGSVVRMAFSLKLLINSLWMIWLVWSESLFLKTMAKSSVRPLYMIKNPKPHRNLEIKIRCLRCRTDWNELYCFVVLTTVFMSSKRIQNIKLVMRLKHCTGMGGGTKLR